MNLDGLITRTQVSFEPDLDQDQFSLNGVLVHGISLDRVSNLLSRVRKMAGLNYHANVNSENNFPTGVGIASSASGFAALCLAASQAVGLELDEAALSRLARTGSGSACRSIPPGFVEWKAGTDDFNSFAVSIAPPEHWDLVDCIVVVSQEQKRVSSEQGHLLASSSLIQEPRVKDAPHRLDICRQAILDRDFASLTRVVELDSYLMHAVMLTSEPPILYWQPETITVIQAVHALREAGIHTCCTIDAGPNVHVLCEAAVLGSVMEELQHIQGIKYVFPAHPGGGAQLENKNT
jgi:diphosphomevalonate decarboxylase